MRLGTKRRIYIRSGRINKRKVSGVLLFIFFALLVLGAALYFIRTVRPVMAQVARSHVRFLTGEIIDEAVLEFFREEKITYSDIVTPERDADGKICALHSNLAGVGQLKTKLSLAIQQKIASLPDTALCIPIGSLFGCDFLAGTGPKIKIRLMPYGDAQVEFRSTFENAGINQTRLCIDVHIQTDLALLMPTVNASCKLEDSIPVLQTIIVGDIPNTYLNIGGND